MRRAARSSSAIASMSASGTLRTASATSCSARSTSPGPGTSGRPGEGALPSDQPRLQQDDDEQEGAPDHRLPVRADVDDVLAVLEDDQVEDQLQQHYADEGGQDRTDTAAQQRAADDHGGDRGELPADAGRRVHGAVLGPEEDAGAAGQRARE